MATISAFKAQMQGGGARTNQFRVELVFPALATNGTAASTASQFLCKSAQLPASILEDLPIAYRGRIVHFAGERQFQPWQVTILNDTNFLIRNAFESWHNAIANYTSTNGILRPSDYQTQMLVHQLDRNDVKIKTYEFFDVYPTNVEPIALGFESPAIEEYGVELTFNYFIPSDL